MPRATDGFLNTMERDLRRLERPRQSISIG